VGMGTMITLNEKSSTIHQELTLLVAGVGFGALFPTPLIAIMAAMPMREMAVSTGAFSLMRTLGITVGVSIGGTIYASVLKTQLADIPDYTGPTGARARTDIKALRNIQPPELRQRVLHAFAFSISRIWISAVPMLVIALLLTFLYKKYSLKRPTKPASPNQESPTDKEKTLEEGNKETVDDDAKENAMGEITAVEDRDNTLSLHDDYEENSEKAESSKIQNSV